MRRRRARSGSVRPPDVVAAIDRADGHEQRAAARVLAFYAEGGAVGCGLLLTEVDRQVARSGRMLSVQSSVNMRTDRQLIPIETPLIIGALLQRGQKRLVVGMGVLCLSPKTAATLDACSGRMR